MDIRNFFVLLVMLCALLLPGRDAADGLTRAEIARVIPWESSLEDVRRLDPDLELMDFMNFSAVSEHRTDDGKEAVVYYRKAGPEPDEYIVERVLIKGAPEWDEFYESFAD